MKNCTKCEEEIPDFGFDSLYDKCYKCRSKEERNKLIVMAIVGILITIIVRTIWAEFVYHDIRCVLAECRILK